MCMHMHIYCMKVEERERWSVGEISERGKGEGTKPEVDMAKAHDICIFLKPNAVQ